MRPQSAFDVVKPKLNVTAPQISRAVLAAQLLTDFGAIKSVSDEFRQSFADLSGLLLNAHGFAIFAVEAPHSTLISYLEVLQSISKPSDNVSGALKIAYYQQLKKQQPKLSQPRVLVFLEDCRPCITSFFACDLNLQNAREQDQKPAEALSFIAVALLKIMSLANLASKNGDEHVYKAIFSIPPSELFTLGYLEKFCAGTADMRNFEVQVSQVRLEVCPASSELEQQMEQVKTAIGAAGEEEFDEIYTLDEFLVELVYNDQMQLIDDETANLNEFWLYENLKHILSD